MSRDEADRTLHHLRDERERIGAALLELADHPGHRLLDGAALTGETARRQAEVRSRTSALWELFDHYQRALDAAETLRARHPRPGPAQLAELTWLLAGPSVELPAPEVPLERRTLLGPPAGERLTLQQVVARMTPLYEETVRLVAAVDAVWSPLLTRLDETLRDRHAAADLAVSLDLSDPGLERLGHELDALAATVRTDPLSLGRDGRADTARFDRIGADLSALRERIAEVARLRSGLTQRLDALRATIERAAAAEVEAARARETVLVKIYEPVLPPQPAAAAVLAGRLDALRASTGRGDWSDLAVRVADLERAAATALEQARTAADLITGLLERRDELRGRLDAYRVKAARLGLAEDPGLSDAYRRIRELLWTSPCDLRRATTALSGYQQAIAARSKGANG
ncbi:hypothetical protein GCM10009678_86230 [Actinomadura kijaniata]|uniref:Uncharacterized protein n=1 Tax=Actinomadura namibiensis TaxID=182080 RepID=A0A7W3QJE6_ACTNM|nr:hypothetical protein [Actinomadura namibiensis]MBA8949394.1 hypothetical protein [Actinomadura namibiensis]